MKRLFALFFFLATWITAAPAQQVGPRLADKAPAFKALDQSGREQSLATLAAKNGLVLVFFRSADWWPFCKMQLVQLQGAKKRFAEREIGLAAVSYDSVEILKSFADRQKIDFPLLADPKSAIIRDFQAEDKSAQGMTSGMANAGYVWIAADGTVRESVFESDYKDRLTGASLLGRLFPELLEGQPRKVRAKHIGLTLKQSDRIAAPGSRVTLIAEIALDDKMHVYAPEVKGYKPVELRLRSTPDFRLAEPRYPKSKMLHLPAIKETVAVYEDTFRIQQDATIAATREFASSLGKGKTVTVEGVLKYQACDDKICYLPMEVPVSWQLQIVPLDLTRAPEETRHK